MKISETFASKYLKAVDLKGRTVRVTITSVFSETLDQGRTKPVLFFAGAQKGLVLNRTNSETLAMAFGDETDNWIGAEIELFPMMVNFQGQMQPAIRVKVPAAADSFNAGPAFAQQPAAQPDRIMPNARQRQEMPGGQYPGRAGGGTASPYPGPYDERNPPPVGQTVSGAALDDEIPF